MIEARGLVKRYGSTAAVNDLSFTIRPGLVTGFLGPNGAGKTTTMRLILGLDYPSAGTVTVDGKPYAQLPDPMHEVGALLDAGAVHGGRTARNHLLCLAQTNGIAKAAVFTAVTLVIALAASFASFFLGQALLTSTHAGATLTQPGVLRAVLASAVFVAMCGLFAFGLGAILRSTAGAITAAFGLLFLVPQLAKALPSTWYADLVRWLPGADVIAVITGTASQDNPPHLFSAWGEFAVFGGYTAIFLIVGAVLFSRRDA